MSIDASKLGLQNISSHKLTTNLFEEEPSHDTWEHSTPPKLVSTNRPKHTTLLITPLDRASGGRVQLPSPSILDKYISSNNLNKTSHTPALTPNRQPTAAPHNTLSSTHSPWHSSLSKMQQQQNHTKSIESKTNINNNYNNYATYHDSPPIKATSAMKTPPFNYTTSPPMAFPSSTSSSSSNAAIKARLRQIIEQTPPHMHATRSPSSNKAASSPATSLPLLLFKTNVDKNADAYSVRRRAHHLQAELQVREMEVDKLASTAAEARKEIHELRQKVSVLTHQLEVQQQRLRFDGTPRGVDVYEDTNTSAVAVNNNNNNNNDDDDDFFSTSYPGSTNIQSMEPPQNEQGKENEIDPSTAIVPRSPPPSSSTTHAAMTQDFHSRAADAEHRCRAAVALCESMAEEKKESEEETAQLRRHARSMEAELRRLSSALASAVDRAERAEAAVQEERSSRDVHRYSEHVALAETALTAQVRALAVQLSAAQSEASRAKQMLNALQSGGDVEGEKGGYEQLLDAHRQLESTVARLDAENSDCRARLNDAHEMIARLSSENDALHAAMQTHSAVHTGSQDEQKEENEGHRDTQIAQLQQELRAAKLRAVQAEDAMARSATDVGGAHHHGPSPLRDVVSTLRAQLHDQELRRAAAEEELAVERQRASELHRQMLDQAVELDDAHRERIAIDALKNELMVVKQAAEAAQKRSAALSNELEEAGKAAEECRELRRILDIRNEQVMQLEGQIQMMARGQLNGDDENWLVA